MNPVATIEPTPHLSLSPGLTCAEWLEIGLDLMRRDREAKWQAADWYAYGKARARLDPEFARQLDLALPTILEDPKRLDAIAKVAQVFAPEERSLELSFEHYTTLSQLPHGEARKLLEKAARDRIPVRTLRYEALGQQLALERRDPDQDDLLASFIRHWNRLPRAVRFEAAEMIADSHGEEIEL